MSGLSGKTSKINTTPQPTDRLRSGVVDYLMGNGVNSGGGGSPFDQIGASSGYQPGQTRFGMAGPVNTQFNAGDSFSRGMVRDVGTGFGAPQTTSAVNPSQILPGADRSQIRDVSSGSTQSVDQLGGANSPFFQNMMAQLSPSFDMRRKLALADATERAGNLTGSGFANALGGAVNRSLGDEQATLAQYASQGLNTEVNRQQADASRALAAGQSNQGADTAFMQYLLSRGNLGLNAATALDASANANANRTVDAARINQTGDIANQNADQTFINQLLQRNAQGLTAQQMGLTAETANQDNQRATYLALGGADAAREAQMAQLDAARRSGNADRYAQLLAQQSGAGVSPDTIQQSGGIGALLSPILAGLGTGIGSGNVNLGGLLSKIFGGGQGTQPNPTPQTSDAASQIQSLISQWQNSGGTGAPSIDNINLSGVGQPGSSSVLGQILQQYGLGGSIPSPTPIGVGLGNEVVPWAPQAGNMSPQQIAQALQQQGGGMGGVLGNIFNKGNAATALAGGLNLSGKGPLINVGQAGGAVAGKAIGGLLGSAIPIPGIGTILGSAAGAALSKPIGKAVSGIGKGIKKIFSDETLKDNIKPMSDGLDTIRSLAPVRFDYKPGWGEEGRQVGFLAQQMQKSIPEAVSRDKRTGKLMIRPDFVIPHLVVATKQLDARLKRMYQWQT